MIKMMKGMGILFVALSLLGCTPDKAHNTAACETETLRFYSVGSGDDFMIQCMGAKGYEFDVRPTECDSRTRMVMQQACYRPVGWGARLLDTIGWPSK